MPSAVTVSNGVAMPGGMTQPGATTTVGAAAVLAGATARARSAPLIWTGAFTAGICGAVFVTANVVTGLAGYGMPVAINLALTATGAVSVLAAVAVHLHHRTDARLALISATMIAHLDDLTARLDELESSTSERALDGFIMPPGHTSVVPFISRTSRVSYLRDPR